MSRLTIPDRRERALVRSADALLAPLAVMRRGHARPASPQRIVGLRLERHVEVYDRNVPSRGYNRWMKQWNLASEPWTFVVGADGRVKAKFMGSVSAPELEAAVRRVLVGT